MLSVDGRLLVRVSANANALIESDGEKVVDNLDAVRTRWNVDAADVSNTVNFTDKLSIGMFFEEDWG